MLINFFFHLKQHQLPVTIKELLDLLQAIDARMLTGSIDQFYFLARLILVKDERYYDRFDQAFSQFLNGQTSLEGLLNKKIPSDWLTKMVEKHLSEEEKQKIQSLGGFDELMETFKQRLKEQKERHQGGNKWIGTGGTSPFGAYGYHPEGIRIGQEHSRHQRAVKVWDKREYRNLDDSTMLAQRNMTLALKSLQKQKRQGALTEFDLEHTIKATAKNAGLLDLQYRSEKQNNLKVLMLFDIGGSMDFHIELTRSLFAAARNCFKSLEFYYFHNCPYEKLWRDNARRSSSSISTYELLRKYNSDYKVIFVGDASMSPYELLYPGASVEHMNDEAGEVWLKRILQHFDNTVWLNPLEKSDWYAQSVNMIADYMHHRMYPLSLQGIQQAVAGLN
jgi:uncharacterized protein with von Willebrand factor type A (vWA) domain